MNLAFLLLIVKIHTVVLDRGSTKKPQQITSSVFSSIRFQSQIPIVDREEKSKHPNNCPFWEFTLSFACVDIHFLAWTSFRTMVVIIDLSLMDVKTFQNLIPKRYKTWFRNVF